MTEAQSPPTEHAPLEQLNIRQLVPHDGAVGLTALLQQLNQAPPVLPFDDSRTAFVAEFARELGRAGRGQPEIEALAFWMRRAELKRLEVRYLEAARQGIVRVPRGTVFHIPPANVDTIFVYSWVLSMLMGNRNIVRLSRRSTPQVELIIKTFNRVLESHEDVATTTSIVSYGHEEEITREISMGADVRVIWGGDDTVRRVRSVPLPPHATELVFPDRASLAAIATAPYDSLDDERRDQLAERFFNDSYWFDQQGCSSARLLIWVGGSDHRLLAQDFHSRVQGVAKAKSYDAQVAAEIAKRSHAYRSIISTDVESYQRFGNESTVLETTNFPPLLDEFSGAGFFYQMRVDSMLAIADSVERSYQTLATFGFDEAQLVQLVEHLSGRGIDRIVPIGQALSFSPDWDGMDLLTEFTRQVVVTGESASYG